LHWLNVAEPVAADPSGEAWFQWMMYSISGGNQLFQPGTGQAWSAMQGIDSALQTPLESLFGQSSSSPTSASPKKSQATGQSGSVRGQIPANVDPTVVDAVLRAARDTNVPYALALALIQRESQFNAKAVGDQGCSKGVAQLNTCAGEGVGVPDYVLSDPYLNAKISFTKLAQVMQQNPGMSWGQAAAAAQRPSDPQGYASDVNNYITQIQTGQGQLGWGLSTIRVGDPSFEHNAQFGANSVPQPFSSDYFQSISQSFGQNGEEGTDFAMPVGQQITSPVGGTIQLRDDGKANWGKAVYVKMPNGWTFFVGHLSNFAVTDGEQIGPGDTIGQSGGDPRDSSSGNSTGPHVEIRFIDPSGKNQDPMTFLQPIYSGTGITFDNWAGGIFSGSAQPNPSPQKLVKTPDGFLIDTTSAEGSWYTAVDSAWTSIYGQHAPLQAARDFQAAGVTTVDGIQNALLNMPSSIPGVTIGSFKNVSDAAQSAAQSAFGRSVPQSLIQQFFQQGITSADDMKLWFDTHSSSDIPTAAYQSIYDAALPYTQSLSNDVPHPNDVTSIYQQASGSAYPGG
jgi:murein DD-endopeptidase MepM/ murein hydrolase activator NlpD